MVAYFKLQNNIFMAAGAALGLIIAAACYQSLLAPNVGYTGVFIVGLFAFVGVILGRVLASAWANRRLARLRGILYEEGDPQRFLDQFGPLVTRVPIGTIEYVDGMRHLAYAWEALGEYDKALELLGRIQPEKLKLHALVGRALVENQKLRLYLLKKEAESARSQLKTVNELQNIAAARAPSVGANLRECIRLASIWLRTLDENPRFEPEDRTYIEEEISLAKNPFHKKEMEQLLALMKCA